MFCTICILETQPREVWTVGWVDGFILIYISEPVFIEMEAFVLFPPTMRVTVNAGRCGGASSNAAVIRPSAPPARICSPSNATVTPADSSGETQGGVAARLASDRKSPDTRQATHTLKRRIPPTSPKENQARGSIARATPIISKRPLAKQDLKAIWKYIADDNAERATPPKRTLFPAASKAQPS